MPAPRAMHAEPPLARWNSFPASARTSPPDLRPSLSPVEEEVRRDVRKDVPARSGDEDHAVLDPLRNGASPTPVGSEAEPVRAIGESVTNGVAAPPGLDPEDRALVERVLSGDQDAFRRMVEKFHRRVAALVHRYRGGTLNSLEDHAQEVFLRVYRGLSHFEGNSSLGTWIHRIAVNYLITDLRKRRAMKRDQRTLSIDAPIHGTQGELRIEVEARGDEPSGQVFDRERGVAIRRAMNELEEDLQQIVLLREIEQLSYEEIAVLIDIPIGTVRSRLHRARGLLQERLRHLL